MYSKILIIVRNVIIACISEIIKTFTHNVTEIFVDTNIFHWKKWCKNINKITNNSSKRIIQISGYHFKIFSHNKKFNKYSKENKNIFKIKNIITFRKATNNHEQDMI